DGDGLLGEDRAGVDVLGDEVDGAARDLHAELERVAHRVPALEAGEERGMRVDGAAAVRVDERLGGDGSEAGEGNEADVRAGRRVDDGVCVGDAVEVCAEVGAFDELGCGAGFACDLERAARPIGDDGDHRQPAFEHRLQDGAAAGGQDTDAHATHPSPASAA